MKKVFEDYAGVVAVLLIALVVAGCAAPRASASGPRAPEADNAGDSAMAAFRKGIRRNPMFDAYAKRYPEQWRTNTRTLWPAIRKALSGRNPQKNREALKALSEKMRTSNLMKDVAIAQRDAMLNLSEEHATRVNALGIENMTYLRDQSPQACAKLLTSDPSAFSQLPAQLRSKQQTLIGELITSTPDEPSQTVGSKTIGRLLAQIDKGVQRKYPDYPGWDKLSLATTDAAVLAKACDYSIEHSKIVAGLSASDRLAVVKFTRQAVSTSTSLEAWKTRVYRIEGTTSLHIVGPMHKTMVRDVQQLVKNNPDLDTVLLDSPGGLIVAGQTLAKLIQARGMNTRVSHICMSACTIALLAGKSRVVSDRALIGFHDSVVSGKSLATVGVSAGYYANLYGELPKKFLDRVKATPNGSMWVPEKTELLTAKVITNVARVSPAQATNTQIAHAYKSNALLETEIESNPYFWANERRRLAAMERFGAPGKVIQFYIRDVHRASIRNYWQQMPDELVPRAAQQVVDKILAIKNDRPALCADIFVGEPLTVDQSSKISNELRVQSNRLGRQLIQEIGYLRSSDSRVTRFSSDDFKGLLPILGAQPRRDTNWFVQSLKAQRKPETDPATCHILANIMKRIVALPPEQRGESFRLMQQATISWKSRDRYGNPLPYSRSFVDFNSISE